jgi:putative PIN domain protein
MEHIKVICDTNIISNYISGDRNTIKEIDKIGVENIAITPIIYIELLRWLSCYKGFTKEERKEYKSIFSSLKMLHLNEDISVLGIGISEQINSLEPSDVLIGASAVFYSLPLYTLNKKHFETIDKLNLW